MPDYRALTEYLRRQAEPVVTLSFAQIERIVGALPKSATTYQAWWANSTVSRPHAHYWIDAHRQATPDFNAGLVRFSVGGDNPRGPNRELRRNPVVGPVVKASTPPTTPPVAPRPASNTAITEDEVKAAIRDYLQDRGYEVSVAWGRERGIDIEARGPDRLVIEAKGSATLQPQQVNYFLGAIGELVQRMNDPNARYGLALPDNRQYRGLVERLPALGRSRLDLTIYFVRHDGQRHVVTEVPPPRD